MTKTRKHRGGANTNQRTVSVKDPFKIKNGSHIIEANGQYYSIKNGHDKDHHVFESIDKYKYGFDKAAGIRFQKSNQTFNYQKKRVLKYYNHNKKTEDVKRINKIQYSVENVSEINKEFNQVLKSMKDVLKKHNFNDEKLNKMNFYDIEQNYYKVQSNANDNQKVDKRNKSRSRTLNELNNERKTSEQIGILKDLKNLGIIHEGPVNGQESPSSTTLHQGTNTQPLQNNKRSPLFAKNGRVILPGKTSNLLPTLTEQHQPSIASMRNRKNLRHYGANTVIPDRISNPDIEPANVVWTTSPVPRNLSNPKGNFQGLKGNLQGLGYIKNLQTQGKTKTKSTAKNGLKGGKKIKTKKRKRMRKNKTRKS